MPGWSSRGGGVVAWVGWWRLVLGWSWGGLVSGLGGVALGSEWRSQR